MRRNTSGLTSGLIVALLFSAILQGGTMETQVTLNLSPTGMYSYAAYWYSYNAFTDGTPQSYQQYHVIVNGDAEESTSLNTDHWSNTLGSDVIPTHPTCYNARISIRVNSGTFACCTTPADYFDESGLQCPEEPARPEPPGPIDLCDEGDYDGQCSPIIINLDRGPYRLSGPDDPVTFDIDADGTPNRITWTGRASSVALLARDLNGNARIDDGAELLGTATRLGSGVRAANGFEALKELDANGDGVVNGSDVAWSGLLLWTDANHDGISQPGELSGITDSGVQGIETHYHWTGRSDPAGNVFRYMGSALFDRGKRPIYDVYFRSALLP